MSLSPLLNVFFADALIATSSDVQFGSQDGTPQKKGTLVPAQATDSVSAGGDSPILRPSNSGNAGTGQEQQQGSIYTDTSGSDEIIYVSVWGAPVVANSFSNHSAAVTTVGKITSKASECVVAEPAEYISKDYLDWDWQHWIGPNTNRLIGWATKDKIQFEWRDGPMGTIYEGILDPCYSAPQCPDGCYRFYDNSINQWSDTSNCNGEPLTPRSGSMKIGKDWGQKISLNNTLQNLQRQESSVFCPRNRTWMGTSRFLRAGG
ncbi:hypothetical protein GQ600_22380 [Phytophthora cactorum]|nr:hypothetical protein GQ600_22380 [Phytophthora cactorum]